MCIKMASFILLVTPWDSLLTMVKYSRLTGWPVECLGWCIGDGALRFSLTLSPKALSDSPLYTLLESCYVGI